MTGYSAPRKRYMAGLIVILAVCGALFWPWPLALAVETRPLVPKITVKAKPRKITIGDPIDYRISVAIPSDFEINEDSSTVSTTDFAIKDYQRKNQEDKNHTINILFRYILSIYQTGKKQLPEYILSYRRRGDQQWQELKSSPVEIDVASVLDPGKESQLRPLKPKYSFWHNPFWWGLALLVLAGGLWAGVHVWRKRKALNALPVPQKPAHVIAYEELAELTDLRLLEQGKQKEYFEKLSHCVRRYLENRFNMRAPWLSTEEFLEQAKNSPALNKEHNRLLKNFLSLADLVKFARYSSSRQEAEDSYNAAKDFVDCTKKAEPAKNEDTVKAL